ncbi:unnamed protein product [Malus baccata var. baccata]
MAAAHHLSQTWFTRIISSSPKCLYPQTRTFFSLSTFTHSRNQPIPVKNFKTFSHIFQQCSHGGALNPGKQAHARMIVSGFNPTVFVTNCLIRMYVKCGVLEYAGKVFHGMLQRDMVSWNTMVFGFAGSGKMRFAQSFFDAMPERDVVLWNSLIFGYWQNGEYWKSVEVYVKMVSVGVEFDWIGLGIQIHCFSVKMGFDIDVVTGSALVDMYGKCKQLDSALKAFRELPEKNWVSWSAVIAGSVQNDRFVKGIELVFRSCAGLSAYRLGTQFHGHAIKTDFQFDVRVGTATLDMYAKCDRMSDARKIFDLMSNRSLQSYNAIIVSYAGNKQGFEALQLFQLLWKSDLGFDEITIYGARRACARIKEHLEGLQLQVLVVKCSLRSNKCVANAMLDMYGKLFLKACAGQLSLNYGMEIHSRIIKSGMGMNLFVGGALVDVYCKCGMMEEAEKIHDRTEGQIMVSWNAIISGFSLLKQNEEAQRFLALMLEMGAEPDNFTYATIHAQIIKHELQSDVYMTSTTIVDMYSKCGNMQDSHLMFKKAPKLDAVTWNAMTLLEFLSTCSLRTWSQTMQFLFQSSELVDILGTLKKVYTTSAQCLAPMVDIIGRSGQVHEALSLIEDMPFEADDVIWRTLLSICKLHGNVKVAEKAASAILQLDPQDSSTYVLLSNIYAEAGMWGEKEPVCSWIEVKDEVHAFLVGDKAHPRCKYAYEKLDLLVPEMTRVGYRPEIDFVVDEEMGEQEFLEDELKISM